MSVKMLFRSSSPSVRGAGAGSVVDGSEKGEPSTQCHMHMVYTLILGIHAQRQGLNGGWAAVLLGSNRHPGTRHMYVDVWYH